MALIDNLRKVYGINQTQGDMPLQPSSSEMTMDMIAPIPQDVTNDRMIAPEITMDMNLSLIHI